nr:hypothetical protein QSJ49_06270 [Halobacterium salinarum]
MVNGNPLPILAQQSGGSATYPDWLIAILILISFSSAVNKIMERMDQRVPIYKMSAEVLRLIIPIPEILNQLRRLEGCDWSAKKRKLGYILMVGLSVAVPYQLSEVLQPASKLARIPAYLTAIIVAYEAGGPVVSFSFGLLDLVEKVAAEIINSGPKNLKYPIFYHGVRGGFSQQLS